MAEVRAEASTDSGGNSTAEKVREQGQQTVQGAASKAEDAVRTQVDQRSTQAGEQVSSAAGDLRSVGEQLRERDNEQGAKVADAVADRAEQAGRYLSESDADRILSDAEDFGRRQPWLVLAGGIAIGIAGARFLKASSNRRYQTSSAPQSSQSGRAGRLPGQVGRSQGESVQPWDQPQAQGTETPSEARTGAATPV